jgi:hypothetical protein
MKPFPAATTTQLEWLQPKTFERYYELRSGGDLVGTLCWERLLSDLATAETAYGTWTLEQIGILNQRVEVRDGATGSLVATYYPKLMGNGVLQFADGRELEWEPTNFWNTDWAFFAATDGQPVALEEGVEHARWRDMFKTQFTVTIDQWQSWSPAELALLAALGLYLIILRQQAAAGAVAATSAAVG